MPDIQVFLLASTYGRDRGLSDAEIGKLAEHVQQELEDEIKWILGLREAVDANKAAATDATRERWKTVLQSVQRPDEMESH